MFLKYYFITTSAALALLTIALPLVCEQAFLNTTAPAETVMIIALGGLTWLLLAHETRRGLGSPGAFLVAAVAFWGSLLWMAVDSSSWTSSVHYAVGMLRIINMFIFIPAAVLVLALGLRWPVLLPLTPLVIATPMVVVLLFESPLLLFGALTAMFLLNYILSRSSITELQHNARTSWLTNAIYYFQLPKLLTSVGAIATLLLLFLLNFGSPLEGAQPKGWLATAIAHIVSYVVYTGPITLMTGLGLQITRNPDN